METYSTETRNGQTDTSLVLVRVALDKGLDEWSSRCDNTQMLIVEQMDDPWSPFATGNNLRRRSQKPQQAECSRLLDNVHRIARNEQFGYLCTECFGHFFAPDIGNTLQSQVDMDGVAWGQIVLDALDDETNQIAVCVDQHRNEQVTLWKTEWINTLTF